MTPLAAPAPGSNGVFPKQSLPARTLWIDVEDLFEYTARNPRPSGIQRLAFELYRELQDRLGADGRVRFVRLDPVRKCFATVSWQSVADLFARLSDESGPRRGDDRRMTSCSGQPESTHRRQARRLVHRLPLQLRHRFLDTARLQMSAFAAFASLFAFVGRGVSRKLRRLFRPKGSDFHSPPDPGARSDAFIRSVRPGDVLLALGAPWSYPDYAGLIEATRARFGIEFGFLVYDIIPLRRPEWCAQGLVRLFRAWFTSVLPLADHIFSISQHSANDLVSFAAQSGIPLRSSVQVIPIGAGFGPDQPSPTRTEEGLPAPGSYVLFVSTIEARKNHMLLFRIWRRMLEEMPAAEVPVLVFAGRVGWLVADLMQQLENTHYLDGKIVVSSDLSDAELGELYRGCLFTVFPSLYEGWGLPVTESLAFGKPCLASNRTSIPEAGGRFCRYFDPDNLAEANQRILETIEDRDGLAAWENEIRQDYRPTPWQAGADSILIELGMAPKKAD